MTDINLTDTDLRTLVYPPWQTAIRAAQSEQAKITAEAARLDAEKQAAADKVAGMALRLVLQLFFNAAVPELERNEWRADGFAFWLEPYIFPDTLVEETPTVIKFDLHFAAIFPDDSAWKGHKDFTGRVRGDFVLDGDWLVSRAYVADRLDMIAAAREARVASMERDAEERQAQIEAAAEQQTASDAEKLIALIQRIAWDKREGEL